MALKLGVTSQIVIVKLAEVASQGFCQFAVLARNHARNQRHISTFDSYRPDVVLGLGSNSGMARALRINQAGGRYHATARGNERKAIFRGDTDRFHFLELLGELGERFGARVHAYVLMDNHFHLLPETPEANLSRAMQWLNVSYSVWFNRRHDRAGHLLQGRFKASIVEDDAGWQEVARYVHLNPVRVAGLRLGKRQRAASRAGLAAKPKARIIAERLRLLREYRWSCTAAMPATARPWPGYGVSRWRGCAAAATQPGNARRCGGTRNRPCCRGQWSGRGIVSSPGSCSAAGLLRGGCARACGPTRGSKGKSRV